NVDLQLGAAVFQFILERVSAEGQFARLAQRDQRLVQCQRQRGGEQEAARLGRGDGVERLGPIVFGEQVDGVLKSARLRQQRRDVLEEDARLGEVGDVPDVGGEFVCVVHSAPPAGNRWGLSECQKSWRGQGYRLFRSEAARSKQ